jgi:hypothetical protein
MKEYSLTQSYRGIPANTSLFGPYPVKGGTAGVYVQKADIPTDPSQGVSFGIYESAILSNTEIFKEVTPQEKAPQ